MARVFQQACFLGIAEGGLGEEAAVPEADVCAVKEEEVVTAFVRGALSASCLIDCRSASVNSCGETLMGFLEDRTGCICQLGCCTFQIIRVDTVSSSYAAQFLSSPGHNTIFDHFLS